LHHTIVRHLDYVYHQDSHEREYETVAHRELFIHLAEVGEIEHVVGDSKHHHLVIHLHLILDWISDRLKPIEVDGICVVHEEQHLDL